MIKMVEIKDLNDERLNIFVRLTGAQLRHKLEPEKGIFIAESPVVIEVAMESGVRPLSLLTDKRLLGSTERLIKRLEEYSEKNGIDIPFYVADREILRSITGFELTRGALCAMERPAPRSAMELLKEARRVAVLEGITDSTNIGAIFRSAAAFGLDAVLVTPTCCDPLCRRAVRVSMGTIFKVPFAKIGERKEDWPARGMAILKEAGFKTCAMALSHDTVTIDDPRLIAEERLAIILGTEGDGLSHSTICSCDYTAKIPMDNGVDSLNVAAAGAVAFWQLARKR